ncbi:MAG TPA: carbon-nitrogen hydrolase family protein [Blastocatellia bacterium]|nr:carbon-nitrogen hydrolase family protein [Blastocatellia bacterium]
MPKTTIACAQIDCRIGDVESNRSKIIDRISEAADRAARLVIFPECAITGYAFESLEEAAQFAEPIDGPTAEAVARACQQTGLYAVVGFIEKEGSRYFNAAMLAGPEGVIGSYRKVHLPYIGADRFLTPGDRPFEVFDLSIGRLGILICYDISFPEAARTLKLMGAELIALPTNWPPGAKRNPEFVLNARALENHVNFAATNRVGTERGWPFIGRSIIVDFNGDTLIEGSGDGDEMLVAEIDFEQANNNRIVNAPGTYEIDRLADRRPEFYELISTPIKRSRTAS